MKLLDPNTLQKSAFAFPLAVFVAGLTLTVNESACYGADSELSKPIAPGQASVEVLLRFYKKSSHLEAQAQSLSLGKSIDGKLSELKEKLRLHNEGKPSAAIDILMTTSGATRGTTSGPTVKTCWPRKTSSATTDEASIPP